MRWRLAIVVCLAASPAFAQTASDTSWADDEAVLRAQNLPTKGDGLLQTLRDRTPSSQTAVQFQKQVSRLKAAPYGERVKATSALLKMGPLIRPLLEEMLHTGKVDAETDCRLHHVLGHFPADKDIVAVTSTARLLQRDKPADSLPVLLDFVPHVANEFVRQEVQRAINVSASADKTLLVEMIKDDDPKRRAAAAEALVRIGGAKDKVAPLLQDAHPQVRFQVGLALVAKHDKAGLPLLIESIADMPPDAVETALELLYRVAGESAPSVTYESKKDAAPCRVAWKGWLDKHQAKLDLAKELERTEMGFTLVTTMAAKVNTKNKVFELDPKREIRWQFDGPRYPLDVHILGPDRLLLAEYIDNRVTERDFKGNVLRTFSMRLVSTCQRLPNGHTFMAGRQMMQVVDREGKEVFSWSPQPFGINAAQRLRNGQFAVATSDGKCRLLDPQGKELKSFQLGPVYVLGGNIEVLSNGRILAPLYSQNCVAEFDWTGAKLWEAKIGRATSATRLANGNTLVTCSLDNPYRIIEIDRNGKEVWSYVSDSRPLRARRR